jgi:hypothetical protein
MLSAHIFSDMTTITTAHATSTAPAERFFERWADMATWPDWNLDTEWVRLDGPFASGATGKLKPKGGPTVRFVVESVIPGKEFVDVSLLMGARLTFRHDVSTTPEGRTAVDVAVTIDGPLAWVWTRILGKGFRASAQPDLDRLVSVAEAA